MQLSELREAVYSQTDLDEDDMPLNLVDLYLSEGFARTVQLEQRWPSYEAEWAVTADPSAPAVLPFPSDMSGLVEVLNADSRPLAHLAHSAARASFAAENGVPTWFSVWGGQIYLWPKPAVEETYEIRGWRQPTSFAVNGNASEVPDCDARLHLPLVHYACSRVYAQQEDEILERTYLDSWSRGVELARADIMRPMHNEPLIMNQGFNISRSAFWNA